MREKESEPRELLLVFVERGASLDPLGVRNDLGHRERLVLLVNVGHFRKIER